MHDHINIIFNDADLYFDLDNPILWNARARSKIISINDTNKYNKNNKFKPFLYFSLDFSKLNNELQYNEDTRDSYNEIFLLERMFDFTEHDTLLIDDADVTSVINDGLVQFLQKKLNNTILHSYNEIDPKKFIFSCQDSYIKCLRSWLSNNLSVITHEKYATSFFNNLYFHDSLNINKFGYSALNISTALIHHLSVINDFGYEIFKSLPNTNVIESKFGNLSVNVSDENGNVKNNNRDKNKRKVNIKFDKENFDVYCFWHSKIERNRERIYFCPNQLLPNDLKIKIGNKSIIGVYHKHL